MGFREGTERRSVVDAPVGLEVLLTAIVAIEGEERGTRQVLSMEAFFVLLRRVDGLLKS